MSRCRPVTRGGYRRWQLAGQRSREHRWQQRTHRLAKAQQQPEQRAAREQLTDQPTLHALHQGARQPLGQQAASDVGQPAIAHTGGAGGLARTATQTAIQMQACTRADRLTFEHALDEINAAARAVQFIAQQLIGGTSRGAKAAVHALAQNVLGLASFVAVAEFSSEFGLHGWLE